jgi:type I restriction enzyme S subunit
MNDAIASSAVQLESQWKPYPAYKDSGVEWLREVPTHWEVCSRRRKLKNGPDGFKIGPFGSQLKLESMQDSGYKVYGQENVIAGDFNLGSKYIGEEKFWLFAMFEARAKSFRSRPLYAFDGCVHFEDRTPCAESA